MSLEGVTPLPPGAIRVPVVPVSRPAATSASPAAAGAPADAPALWDLLTPEEQAFFAAQSSRGPLTYRPGRRAVPALAPPTGQRVDRKG